MDITCREPRSEKRQVLIERDRRQQAFYRKLGDQ